MRAPTSTRWLACLAAGLLFSTAARAASPLTPDEVSALDAALRDRSTPMKVRLEAALIAGKAQNPELVPPLLEALGDPEFPVRAAAAMSLGGMGDARAADGLVGRLDDPERFVRDEATEALGSLVRRGYGRALQEQVRHWDPPTRIKVAELAQALGPGLGDGLMAEALADPDPSVHAAAQQALSGWKPPDVQKFLVGQLSAGAPRVQAAAAVELGERHLSLAIPFLAKMLVSPTERPEALAGARKAMQALSSDVDLAKQIQLARSGTREERSQAMAVLAATGVSDAYTVLEAALDDADLSVRAEAATDLAVLGDHRAAHHLAILVERPENASIQPVLQRALRRLQP